MWGKRVSHAVLAGIDMQGGKRHAAEEGFARQPDHHIGVFAERPEQGDLLQPGERLAKDVDALRLELIEVIHARRGRRQTRGKFLRGGPIRGPRPVQLVSRGIVLQKMHLCHFAFGGDNSIVAAQKRRKNFLFARSK